MSSVWRQITADWKGETSFIARNAAGGSVQMGAIDGKPGIGPMELLLAGLAGCTGMDIASILLKKRQPLVDLKVQVHARMAEEYPKVYTEIRVIYLIWGAIDVQALEQAIQLSEEKYCSVGIMLKHAAPVHSEYRILNPGDPIPDMQNEEMYA